MKNPGIYILTNTVNGKQYVGRDRCLPSRANKHLNGQSPNCPRIHRTIKKNGNENFSVEIIQYPGISDEALNAVERWKIRQLRTLSPSGYNLTEGGEGLFNPPPEIRQKMSKNRKGKNTGDNHPNFGKKLPDETCQKISLAKKGKNTGDNHPNFGKKPSDETCQKISKSAQERVANGTHNFLDSEFARRNSQKRLEDGTHNFLGDNNPVYKRLEDGTHHFLGGGISRRITKKRVEDGTHNFLGGEANQKRLDEGTHNFLGDNHPMKRLAKEGKHPKTMKRLKAEWCYIIALSRFYYEIHDYTLKRRSEFLSKDIPDMSNSEQKYLF